MAGLWPALNLRSVVEKFCKINICPIYVLKHSNAFYGVIFLQNARNFIMDIQFNTLGDCSFPFSAYEQGPCSCALCCVCLCTL